MKKLFTFCFSLLLLNFTYGQSAPAIEWQRVIGGSSSDYFNSAKATDDGGYILAGHSYSGISGDKSEAMVGYFDYWVVKLDSVLNIEWENSIRADDYDELEAMDISDGNGCLIAGTSNSDMGYDKSEDHLGTSEWGDRDFWVVKIDQYGGPVWDNTIGAGEDDYMHTAIQTMDGGYLVGGLSYGDASFDKSEDDIGGGDYWIIKLTSDGDIEFENSIQGEGSDVLAVIRQHSDGGYFLGGSSSGSDAGYDKSEGSYGNSDYWVVRLNSAGDIIWDKTIGGSGTDIVTDMQITPDGGLIVAGYSDSDSSGLKSEDSRGGFDYWIVKLSMTGNVQWEKNIGGDSDDFCRAIAFTGDGFAVGGTSQSDFGGEKSENTLGSGDKPDFWVVRLGVFGDIIWDNTIGGMQYDYLTSLEYQEDGGILLGGYSDSKVGGDKAYPRKGGYDYWIVKLLPEGSCTIEATITASGPTTFCKPGNVVLNAPLGAGYSYQWKKDGVNISGATGASYTAAATGGYSVEITEGGCSDLSDAVVVTVVNKPPATIENLDAFSDLCFDPSIKLKATTGIGLTYQWKKDFTAIPGETAQIYYATTVGNYTVTVTNSSGCNKTSPPYEITNSCRLQNTDAYAFTIYPNPNTGTFIFQLDKIISDAQITFRILNFYGAEIYSQYVSGDELQYTITLPAWVESGVYFLQFESIETSWTKQFNIIK